MLLRSLFSTESCGACPSPFSPTTVLRARRIIKKKTRFYRVIGLAKVTIAEPPRRAPGLNHNHIGLIVRRSSAGASCPATAAG
jgi:hypothetical protein